MSLAENLQRQMEEVQALRAMYPEDEGCFVLQTAEQQALAAVTAALQATAGQQALPPDMYLTSLSGTVMLPGVTLSGSPVSMKFQLPAAYPAEAAAQITLVCNAPRSIHDELTSRLTAAAQDAIGSESLLLLLDRLQEEVTQMDSSRGLQIPHEHCATESSHTSSQPQQKQLASDIGGQPAAAVSTAAADSCGDCLLRTVIWFHHIKSTEKRKNLVSWARELSIGGFSKPGFPGVVVIEGALADVSEYVARVRALQWQALQVRGQELVECPACLCRDMQSGKPACKQGQSGATLRGFEGRFEELPETGMSDLGIRCKEAGMHDLFLAALKISR